MANDETEWYNVVSNAIYLEEYRFYLETVNRDFNIAIRNAICSRHLNSLVLLSSCHYYLRDIANSDCKKMKNNIT